MFRGLRSLTLTLVLTAAGGWSAAQAAPVSRAALERVDRYATDWVAKGNSPGLVVGVMQNGRVLMVRGYGYADLESRAPVTADTVFRAGSLQKQFTAAAVLKLVEAGKLSLDDRLSKFFPGFYRGHEVTVRQLLNHTAGITNYTSADSSIRRRGFREDVTTDQMVEVIKELYPPYQFSPGEGWSYSNSNYYLAGAIVEKASGRPLADFLRDEVFLPAGMTRTALDVDSVVVVNRAQGYDVASACPTGYRRTPFLAMSVAGPAGALRTTAGDLLRWQDALLGGRVLQADTLQEMLTPGRLNNGQLATTGFKPTPQDASRLDDYALGLGIGQSLGRRRISHGGGINGFNSALRSFPDDKLAWVALANSREGVEGLLGEFDRLLLDPAAAKGPLKGAEPPKTPRADRC